jgi:predicted NACHT family NTPase
MTNQRWLELSDLLTDFNPDADNFDRLGLGKVRQQRVPGLKAVIEHPKLMVLGKPGAGKTTFLKHIAIECNKSKFQADRIPIFIPLKIFAEDAKDSGNFDLLQYIHQEFLRCDLAERAVTEAVLNEGRGLILLDGLDEVPDEDSEQLVKQLRRFIRNYHKNQFIISCRIAAFKYRFKEEGFTEVEVADFNDKQIEDFAKNWFVVLAKDNRKEGLDKAKQFFEKLTRPENQQIRELAVTPILLNLACLVFQDAGDFPSKRSKLYEQGLDILLIKWDEARGIQRRDEVYRSLTLPRKKQLLAQVAAITFERGDYFFYQDKMQQLIADYLSTLPDAKTDRAEMQLDSEAVLKAIEAQHGLLVERARGIYSFSHLTFQEYFTARYFVESSGSQALEQLSGQITDKRWREVFLLTAEMAK